MILTKGRRMPHESETASGTRAYGAGRLTQQRRAVASTASALGVAFTADDLAAKVRLSAPGVSTATVYRSIAAMSSSGYLIHVGERDGAALYARCQEAGHHHHVVCTGCGATAHTPCPVADATLSASAPEGFVVTSHEIRLYGLCATCSDRERAADGCSCDTAVESVRIPAAEAE